MKTLTFESIADLERYYDPLSDSYYFAENGYLSENLNYYCNVVFDFDLHTNKTIWCHDFKGKNVKAKDIHAKSINAVSVSANDIFAWNIECDYLDADTIDCNSIYAYNVNTDEIDAMELNVSHMHANDIRCNCD